MVSINCPLCLSSTISFSIILILLATFLQSSSSFASTNKDPLLIASHRTLLANQRNPKQQQIPNCSEMVTRSQCSQNPKCRWCKSEALDDMCFTKIEAWRLPQQVFLCD